MRPRIIIADADVNYLLPLQLKFIEEFFEKIDLEILTEKRYFEEVFSNPQKAEILIVSEEFYDLSLAKHNLGRVFLMTEQYEEEETAALHVYKIFKYSSIQNIFHEILGKSGSLLQVESQAKQETQIVVVTSAAGGVGKTTVAMGISACLTKNYKRVLYIDAERLQTFQRMFKNQCVIVGSEIYEKLCGEETRIYEEIKHVIRKECFYYLPAFKTSLMSLGLPYGVFRDIALSAKKEQAYDYIIIDSDNVFDEEKANLMNEADKVVFVTNQTKQAVYASNRLVSNINGTQTDKYIFICNNLKENEENALISPDMDMKFTVHDYIQHVRQCEQMNCEELEMSGVFQKAAFLLI